MTRVKNILTLNRQMKLLIVEALIFLAIARIVKGLPFSKTSKYLGEMNKESSITNYQANIDTLKNISSAIHFASKYAPWETMCLVRAIASMKMLERRGIESTLYLGTSRNNVKELTAHAWLRSGNYYVTGADERHLFTITCTFAKRLG
ncbi:lasso peptide biosynthesis B2 protein [Metabacillus idriensis]|uniref:lasso peptide biosynthesis B2 protein n=1 Tax=Metabacillus idriensis TaxID=324768 RepID=UPI001748E566|nr:lasso peptide biosynthesis B2 protein [Metabacillus idriensis]